MAKGTQAYRPCLHGLMADEVAGVNTGQRFERQVPALIFPGYPVRQSLLEDPFTRLVKSGGDLIKLFRQWQRNMGGKHSRVHDTSLLDETRHVDDWG